MAYTLARMVELRRVQVVKLHSYGAHGQVGEQEYKIRQAEEHEEMVEYWDHGLLGENKDAQEVTNNTERAG